MDVDQMKPGLMSRKTMRKTFKKADLDVGRMKQRFKIKTKRMGLEKRRLTFKKERGERMESQLAKEQECQERRAAIAELKVLIKELHAEVEVEREERGSMIAVMTALLVKLKKQIILRTSFGTRSLRLSLQNAN